LATSPRLIGTLKDSGHRQPRLLNADLHQLRPAPIRRQGLGLGIVRQFGAKGQEKRLRQQQKAFEDATAQPKRKPRRGRLAISPAKREWILERHKPFEAEGDPSDGSEARLDRFPQCAREGLEKPGLDGCARHSGFASQLVRTIDADGLAEIEDTIRLSMRSSSAIMKRASGSALA
jgi:hypothetical protein